MSLFGIYGEHTQACPLYNEQNRKFLLANAKFHSALEHTFLWVVDADNPHLIEELMARTVSR
jgi:hypothetical protein